MRNLLYLRYATIFFAVLIGLFLPLRTAGFNVPLNLEYQLDVMVSCVAALNIYTRFRAFNGRFWDFITTPNLGLLLDIFCLIPLFIVEQVLLGRTQTGLGVVALIMVRYIWEIRAVMDEFPNIPPVVYRLVPLGIMMPLLVHLIACGWMALGSGSSGTEPDKLSEYIKAIYWAVTTLTTVGYGDITAKTPWQMLYACGTQIMGVAVFGFVLSNVASLLSRMDAAREHHMENFDRMETFLTSHHIPLDLRNRVRNYYHYLWKNHKGYSDWSIIRTLPPKVQSELLYVINKSIVEKVPLFKGATAELIEDLMHELRPRIAVPGETIFRAGEPGQAMFFIQSGDIEIFNPTGERIVVLREGAFFGEMALLNDRPRAATAKATTYTDLYVLSKDSFNRAMRAFPEFRNHIETIIKERAA